jgi:hypothetical protein
VALVVDGLSWDEQREARRAAVDVEDSLGPGVVLGPLVLSGEAWDHSGNIP